MEGKFILAGTNTIKQVIGAEPQIMIKHRWRGILNPNRVLILPLGYFFATPYF